MNDIEILEKYVKLTKISGMNKERGHAIENLINRVKELEKIVEAYNVIPNDYIPKDMKIVIADREYFNNGILKETCLPKSKIKEKIEELEKDEEFYREQDRIYEFEGKINILKQLLEE